MKKTVTLSLVALAGSVALAQAGDRVFGDGSLPEHILEQIDVAPADGEITEEEIQAWKEERRQRRSRVDSNNDGEITDEERNTAREAMRERIEEMRCKRFEEADTSGDGELSLEEFSAIAPMARLAEKREGVVERIFNRLAGPPESEEAGTSISKDEFVRHLGWLRPVRPPHDREERHPRRPGIEEPVEGEGDGEGGE